MSAESKRAATLSRAAGLAAHAGKLVRDLVPDAWRYAVVVSPFKDAVVTSTNTDVAEQVAILLNALAGRVEKQPPVDRLEMCEAVIEWFSGLAEVTEREMKR